MNGLSFRAIRLAILCVLLAGIHGALAASWKTYDGCELREDRYFDGDSFYAKTFSGKRAYSYIFRLYGADCPETDERYPERIAEQARYFHIPEGEVTRWGEKAKNFVKQFLRKPFTVHTKKEGARGASGRNRYYAVVINADGRNLAEALIEAGLARAYGQWVAWPESSTGERFRRGLERGEGAAKSKRIGIWGRGGPANSAWPFPSPATGDDARLFRRVVLSKSVF